MQLTEVPEIVTWPETYYVFVEKVGPFQINAPAAWKEFHALLPALSQHNVIKSRTTLYKSGANVYRAGVSLAAAVEHLPDGLSYEKFAGGKYSRFVLTGPYSDLPAASRRVFEIVREKKIGMRDDFCIENYVSDPRTGADQQPVTEILIPTE